MDARDLHGVRQAVRLGKGCARRSQHRLPVRNQGLVVPLEEETAVSAPPMPLPARRREEGAGLGAAVGVLRLGVRHPPERRLPGGVRRLLQHPAHAGVVRHDEPNAGVLPSLRHHVRWVPQLAARAHAHLDLHDGAAQVAGERAREGAHAVPVHGQGVALPLAAFAGEHGLPVRGEGQAIQRDLAGEVLVQEALRAGCVHDPRR
mmetsp:Transcript_18549/g.52772  ORF Transcript_18549/g.52772 Transcript_18549/m.52772 type:complete len:204 (-) Transcript_18549:161-772(-)